MMPLSVYSTSVNGTDINTNDCVYFIKSLKYLCNIGAYYENKTTKTN